MLYQSAFVRTPTWEPVYRLPVNLHSNPKQWAMKKEVFLFSLAFLVPENGRYVDWRAESQEYFDYNSETWSAHPKQKFFPGGPQNGK